MKRIILTLSAIMAIIIATAAQPIPDMPEKDMKILQNCIQLMDKGMTQVAMTDFDYLVKKYPDDYIVQYEHMYALYILGQYEDVTKKAKKLLKHKDLTPLTYHMYGNALDNLGKTDKARKTYLDGLKRFPDAGVLYLELGVMNLKEEKYNDAMVQFETGILASPSFASNYYRAANLYFSSNKKIWGLIYGETSMLLAINNVARQQEMGKGIRDTWMSAFSTDGSTTKKVSFNSPHNTTIDQSSEIAYLDFLGVFEDCANIAASKQDTGLYPFTGNIAQLAGLRRGIVEAYFEITGNLYGNSMYLFPFHKKVIDAGHWEAYNYFLFNSVCNDEFVEWYKNNRDKMDAFFNWYNSNPLTIDSDHSVSQNSIFNQYRKINLIEAFTIQANMITDKKEE